MKKPKGPTHQPKPFTEGERAALRSLCMLSAGGSTVHHENVAWMSRLWAKNPAEYGEVADAAVRDLQELKHDPPALARRNRNVRKRSKAS